MRRTFPLLLTAAALLAAGVTACGDPGEPAGKGASSGSGGGTRSVTIGAIAIVDTAPVYLAQSQGFFKKHGIDAKITSVQGGAASITGVMGGQFAFGFANTTSLLTAQQQGLPLKVVANGVASTGERDTDYSAVLVPEGSPVKSAKDLAGRTVAVNQLKNIGDTTVRAAVRKDGGDASKVEFVEMPFPDMPAALAKGRVDAVWEVEPFVTQATGQGARAVAWPYADAAPDLTVAMYFTTQPTLQKDPELVKDFTAAMNEALAYADAHPDAVREILKSYTSIPAEAIAKIKLPKWPAEINRESVQTVADDARQDGTLTKDADVAALLP
ncbi:ABC transporter substrate-binding protein [Actinacidiphila glaucinigra]|uniref:ABC transporter substrate-binding protein n=1 Tax=Actinacidiphila glaucinigra TaxID=235986 RepID=UPI0035D8DE07